MIQQILAEDLRAKQAAGGSFYLFDVRAREEWDESKIPGARLLLDVSESELEAIPKSSEIIFHCRSGARSQRMAELFQSRGYTHISNLAGGILAWQKQS